MNKMKILYSSLQFRRSKYIIKSTITVVRLKLENRIRLYFVVMASLLGFSCFHHFLLIRFSACLKSHANMTFYSGVKYNLFYKGFDQTFFLKTFMNYFFGQGSMCQGYRATAIRHFTFDH